EQGSSFNNLEHLEIMLRNGLLFLHSGEINHYFAKQFSSYFSAIENLYPFFIKFITETENTRWISAFIATYNRILAEIPDDTFPDNPEDHQKLLYKIIDWVLHLDTLREHHSAKFSPGWHDFVIQKGACIEKIFNTHPVEWNIISK